MSHSTASKSSKYIWDEWPEDDKDSRSNNHDAQSISRPSSQINVPLPPYAHFPPPPSSSARSVAARRFEEQLDALEIDEATVSSIGLDSFMPRSYSTSRRESARPPMEPDGFAADYGGSSTVSKVVQEVAAKIERMKKELQERKERAKQLQGELMRVESAKERREKKIVEKWELQLRKLDDEHRKTYDEMQSFRDRLAQDIKKLEAQSHELKGKLSKMAQDHEQQLHFARQENLKKLDKAKKQWRQDEKGFMEKVLNSRMEQLKKQAVDSLTPELDNLVRANKEALEALRVEHENQLRKLTMTLEHEVERKIESYRQSLQDEVRDESEKAQEVTRKRLDTARRALEQEHEQTKGKFESDKQHLTEEYERLIAQEDTLHQQSMTALQEKQATMVQELLTQQQKAVSDLLSQQSQEMASIQSRLKDEVTSFQESLLKLQSQQAETRFKYLQQQLFADVAKETDEIHRKLREDAEHHRKEMIARYEQDLQSLRQSMSSNVESLQEQETKAHLRLTQLRSEVEQLKAQLDAKRQANPALLHMINQELKPKLQTLRQDLRQAEDEFYQQEGQLQRTQEQVHDDKAQQLHEMQRRVEELHQREEDQVRQLAQRRSQSETDFAMDLQRIQSKIEAMLARRRQVVVDLRTQLVDYRQENHRLEEEVERRRNASYR